MIYYALFISLLYHSDNVTASNDKASCVVQLPDPTLCFTALCVSHPWTLFIHPLKWQHPAL